VRASRILVLLSLLVLPLVFASGAGALDLEVDVQPPPGEVGTAYEFQFKGEEGCLPYRFSYLNGTLPPGLHVTEDGKLTGTPTEAGTFSFWVALDDASGPGHPGCIIPSVQSQGQFTMVVLPDLAVTTKSLPNGVPGQPYSAQLEFSNPEAGWPVVWDITAGSLPLGLTLSESGLISGTPVGVDRKTFTVRAREPFRRSAEQELTLTVGSSLEASASFGPGEVGVPYKATVKGSGGVPPISYSADGTLPPGLTLDAKTGTVSGTPSERGLYSFKVVVSDAAGQKLAAPAVVRIAAQLTVRTSRLPVAHARGAYGARLRAGGGLAPRTWRVASGSLPRGLRLVPAGGTLVGVPRKTGAYRFTVEVKDRLGAVSSKALRLVVR